MNRGADFSRTESRGEIKQYVKVENNHQKVVEV